MILGFCYATVVIDLHSSPTSYSVVRKQMSKNNLLRSATKVCILALKFRVGLIPSQKMF